MQPEASVQLLCVLLNVYTYSAAGAAASSACPVGPKPDLPDLPKHTDTHTHTHRHRQHCGMIRRRHLIRINLFGRPGRRLLMPSSKIAAYLFAHKPPPHTPPTHDRFTKLRSVMQNTTPFTLFAFLTGTVSCFKTNNRDNALRPRPPPPSHGRFNFSIKLDAEPTVTGFTSASRTR